MADDYFPYTIPPVQNKQNSGRAMVTAEYPVRVNAAMVEKRSKVCSNQPVVTSVYIGLGSNEGDRELHLLRAVAELGRLPATKITALSPFYETEPEGGVRQGDFLNAVARLSTELTPHQLLAELQRIETKVFRRVRAVPGGPRPMDLDILLYDNLAMDSAALTIPHPRLHERRFVLQPLVDIAPDLVHPLLGKSVTELLAVLPTGRKVVRI